MTNMSGRVEGEDRCPELSLAGLHINFAVAYIIKYPTMAGYATRFVFTPFALSPFLPLSI